MKHGLLYAFGLIVLSVVAFVTSPAEAATAPGPYYATPSWDQQLPASTRFHHLIKLEQRRRLGPRDRPCVGEVAEHNYFR